MKTRILILEDVALDHYEHLEVLESGEDLETLFELAIHGKINLEITKDYVIVTEAEV